MEINTSVLLESYPAGETLNNATKLVIQPSIVDGIYYNYHIIFIEQIMLGILVVLLCILGFLLFNWFMDKVLPRD